MDKNGRGLEEGHSDKMLGLGGEEIVASARQAVPDRPVREVPHMVDGIHCSCSSHGVVDAAGVCVACRYDYENGAFLG